MSDDRGAKERMSFSNMTQADLELIYRELSCFRWPAILPLKPADWHDPNPYFPWPEDNGLGMDNYRRWAKTPAGLTQTAIMNEIGPLLGIPPVSSHLPRT